MVKARTFPSIPSYEKWLIVCSGLTVAHLVEPGLILITAVLVLPALLLAFAPTTFVYMISVWPAVLLWRKDKNVVVCFAAAVLGILSVGAGIPAAARLVHEASTDEFRASDHSLQLGSNPKTIAIVIGERVYRKIRKNGNQAPCKELCQTLLNTNRFSQVLVANNGRVNAYSKRSPVCRETGKKNFITGSRVLSRCIDYFETEWPEETDLEIEVELKKKKKDRKKSRARRRRSNSKIDLELNKTYDAYTVTFRDTRAGNQRILGRKSFLRGAVASVPLRIMATWNGGVPTDTSVIRELTGSWEIGAAEEVINALGSK